MLRQIATVVLASLLAGSAVAQGSGDELKITQTDQGTRVAVKSSGRLIAVGSWVGPDTTGELVDLDGDGAMDVVLSEGQEDSWGLSVWLRRGGSFKNALNADYMSWDRILDLDGDGKLEGIYPEPTPLGVFAAFSIKQEGLYAGDTFKVYRLKGNKYVPGKVDCTSPLRDEYLKAIDEVDRTLTRNETGNGSSFEDNSFATFILKDIRRDIRFWRARFSEGCTS